MKHLVLSCALVFTIGILHASDTTTHKTIPVGTQAPDFKLKGVDGKMYSLAAFKNSKILVIVFTCNHCPTAQAYEDRIIRLASDYQNKGVAVVAIMPNDPAAITPSELNYTDLGDTYDEMKIRAKEKNFNFPYLYDGETQATAKAYGPIATPHVFIFDKERRLQYSGRIDDVEKPSGSPRNFDTRNAIENLLNNQPLKISTTKVFGCSIKWAEKESWHEKAQAQWAKENVTVDTVGEAGLKKLVQNESDKLRLINVWATWCGPCVTEFPELVNINRMYRSRDFEFVSISADDPQKKNKVLDFLKKQQASSSNYLFNVDDKYRLINAIDSSWQGDLPYTIVVEPGGKIIYRKDGRIDEALLKKAIVDNKLVGRYY